MASPQNELHGALYTILRRAGIALTAEQHEKVRLACKDLEEKINKQAERKAIEVCKRLQVATGKAFQRIGNDISNIEHKIDQLDRRLSLFEPKR